jgi:hypothetical protein
MRGLDTLKNLSYPHKKAGRFIFSLLECIQISQKDLKAGRFIFSLLECIQISQKDLKAGRFIFSLLSFTKKKKILLR